MAQHILLVALGGSIGSILRFILGEWIRSRLGATFPFGTLLVNVSGSFCIAFLYQLNHDFWGSSEVRLFLGVGLLGGFTTYSSFNYEFLAIVEAGRLVLAAIYAFSMLIGAIGGGFIGLSLGRWLSTG